MTDALAILNMMLDQWNAERLMVYAVIRVVNDVNSNPFNLVPGQQTYTLGTGGNFNYPRPTRVERAGIISLNNPAQPLELPLEMLTDAGWEAIPVKNITSTLPQKLWIDTNFPFMNLNFWCIPSVQVQLALYLWQIISGFTDPTVLVSLPPGYLKALRYCLAVDLAPEWGRPVPPEVAAQAIFSKAFVKTINIPLVDLQCDKAIVGGGKSIYNWLTDNANISGT